jgi:hypothetical protein
MPATWTKAVYSTMVSEVGWDQESQDLLVTWANGRQSAYSGVPEDVAVSLSNAPSVGTMINSEIKPYYPHRYV